MTGLRVLPNARTPWKMIGFPKGEFWALDQHSLGDQLAFVQVRRLRSQISYVITGEESQGVTRPLDSDRRRACKPPT